VSSVRRASRLGHGPPLTSRPQTPTLLKNVVAARRYLLQTLDAVRAGPRPHQQPLTEEDRQSIANVASEIRDAAEELVSALRTSQSHKLRAVEARPG
jgi:hypothetical protein